MRRMTLLLAGLLAGLALIALVGYLALNQVTRQWFEKDLQLRAQLAVSAARQSLAANWKENSEVLAASLRDMARDERILGAAACAPGGRTLARSDNYPAELSCAPMLARLAREDAPQATTWIDTAEQPKRPVQVSAIALHSGDKLLGSVLVVHDLGFVSRREATTMYLVIAAFLTLAIGVSVLTIVAARLLWSRWTSDLRRALADDEVGSPGTELEFAL